MALRDAILAALLEGEASGYELSKRFHVSVANFWAATPQQMYRELEDMERQGLVSSRMIQQERRPNKRMFSITDPGRSQLAAFSRRPPRPLALRDDLLVQVQAIDAGDIDSVRAAVGERLEQARRKLARYEELRAQLLDGAAEPDYLRAAATVGPYLTLLRGCAFERENITWAERTLEILAARARLESAARARSSAG